MSTPTVIFAGGGTGGHIFPGVAISEQLQSLVPGVRSLFVCSARPGDAAMLSGLSLAFEPIPAQPFGLRPKAFLKFASKWGTCVRSVRGLIAKHREQGPVVVVALGGFVAAPAAQAARAERVPLLLVNLDAVPGRANRWIARHATRTLTAAHVEGFDWEYIRPIIRSSATVPGDAAHCRRLLGLDPLRPTLFVTGASLGAKTINEFLAAFVGEHRQTLIDGAWQVIHQTGKDGDAPMRAAYERAGIPCVVVPFLDAMGVAWGAADCAVSRSGAGSVAEAWSNGVPTLFMPYPHHADEHQRLNALPLANQHAAVICRDLVDPALNLAGVGPHLLRLLQDEPWRAGMRDALRRHGRPEGALLGAKAAASLLESPRL